MVQLIDISFFQLYLSINHTRSSWKMSCKKLVVEQIEFLIIRVEEKKLVKYFDKLKKKNTHEHQKQIDWHHME